MPSEIRQIIFRNDELTEAIDSYRVFAAEELPAGDVVSCTLDSHYSVTVKLGFAEKGDPETSEVELPPSSVAAALLAFCIGKGIPIPRYSDKSIQIIGDNIALVIRMGAASVSFTETIEVANPYREALRIR